MNRLEHLLKLKENPENIYYTWKALGGISANNSTLIYTKDCLYRITEPGDFEDAFVFCLNEYITAPDKGFEQINWNSIGFDELDGRCFFYQGVESPNFRVILTPEKFKELNFVDPLLPNYIDTNIPAGFIPFEENGKISFSSNIIIPDEEYIIIMTEMGVPFLNEDELEYSKDTVLKTCIKPAIDVYYSYFPLVIDEAYGPVGSGAQWEVEYHNFQENKTAIAYKANPYITLGAAGTTGTGAYSSAFAYTRENMFSYGGSNMGGVKWGRGLTYRKPVPGFVGLHNSESMLMAMAARQGYLNYFRREYARDIIKDGKKYAQGYASTGGFLNIHWLCTDLDYSHIPYDQLMNVRKLCTAYVLRNFGSLRTLLKSDSNVPFNTEQALSRADDLERKVLELYEENKLACSLALHRGSQ